MNETEGINTFKLFYFVFFALAVRKLSFTPFQSCIDWFLIKYNS